MAVAKRVLPTRIEPPKSKAQAITAGSGNGRTSANGGSAQSVQIAKAIDTGWLGRIRYATKPPSTPPNAAEPTINPQAGAPPRWSKATSEPTTMDTPTPKLPMA